MKNEGNTQRGKQRKESTQRENEHDIKQTCCQAKEGVLEGQM